jgi:hypothetical protein
LVLKSELIARRVPNLSSSYSNNQEKFAIQLIGAVLFKNQNNHDQFDFPKFLLYMNKMFVLYFAFLQKENNKNKKSNITQNTYLLFSIATHYTYTVPVQFTTTKMEDRVWFFLLFLSFRFLEIQNKKDYVQVRRIYKLNINFS